MNRRVTNKTTNPDGSITLTLDIDPDDNPTDDFYDTNKQILRIQDAKTDAIHKGATGVKWGFQAYTEAANTFLGGPFYNLGIGALSNVAGKGISLIGRAEKVREYGAKLGRVLGGVNTVSGRLRTKLGTLSEASQEAALVRSQIKTFEDDARKLTAGIDEAEDFANAGEFLGKVTKHNAEQAKTANELIEEAGVVGGKIHIDVGGEGKYQAAINMNPINIKDVSVGGLKIPNWVRARSEQMPFKSGVADLITVENTLPMGRAGVSIAQLDTMSANEIARVIKSGGQITLSHAQSARSAAWHDEVASLVGGSVSKETLSIVDEYGSTIVIIKTTIFAP